jgi:hypothetical protein
LTTNVENRVAGNDELHLELRRLELIRLDQYLPESEREAARQRITQIIRELTREGRFEQAKPAEEAPRAKAKKA